MVGVEAGGLGIKPEQHAARFQGGSLGVLQGTRSYILQDEFGQIQSTHSVSAGLDYAAVGPEHAWLARRQPRRIHLRHRRPGARSVHETRAAGRHHPRAGKRARRRRVHGARAEDGQGRAHHREPLRSRRQRRGAGGGEGEVGNAVGECYMIPTSDQFIRTPSDFRKHFNVEIAFVPVLGPVDHNEKLFEKEAARLALLSHGASRNFRNIWYHFPDGFAEFRKKFKETWPGMDIEPPEIMTDGERPYLRMFCPEERYPREIFWAGFGFQVWCQMLTFILQARDASALVIDEPDIYLHSDLQRQLVGLLRELGPQIIVATHSAEIITEVEPQALLNVNKRFRSAKHVKDTRELQEIFQVLGSNLNPTLTQLAKTRRVVFVEGKDFQIFSRFARRLGLEAVANRADFAVVPVDGFNPQKVKDFASGMEATLGAKLLKVAIFDRDYRCDAEVAKITADLERFCRHAVVHDCKELENFLLQPLPIERAIKKRVKGKATD